MSQKDRSSSSNPHQSYEGENETKQLGRVKTVVYLLIATFILGLFIGSGVTFVLLKSTLVANNPAPTPAPLPIPASASPSPMPLVEPSPSPTESATSNPQPSSSPELNNNTNNVPATSSPIASKNSDLPGYFPQQGFKAPPSDLSRFKKANLLIENMVISGQSYITFLKGKILIRGQLYSPIFRLRGESNEQRVGFELDGLQKGLLLQFGQQDLSAGDTNLTYLVRVLSDGKLVWAGECRYGKDQQIISVPLDGTGAKSLVIEYAVTEQGGFSSWNMPPLYFTRAELLYE